MAPSRWAKTKTICSKPAHILCNFSVQYSFGSAAVAILIMSSMYCTIGQDKCNEGAQAGWVIGTLNGMSFVGAVVGQLTMGYMGDLIGRSNALLFTMILATIANICSAAVPSGSPTSVYATIVIFRFFLGVGLGGVFPLSATKAAEDEGTSDGSKVDPQNAAWSYFWQVPGIMGPWFTAYLLSFDSAMSAEKKWRLILGLGAVPTGLACVCLLAERFILSQNSNRNSKSKKAKMTITKTSLSQLQLGYSNAVKDSPGSTDDGHEDGVEEEAQAQTQANGTNSTSLTDAFIVQPPSGVQSDKTGTKTGTGGRMSSEREAFNSKEEPSLLTILQREYILDKHLVAKFLVSGGCWFLFDIVVYGIGMFTGQILHSITSPHANISTNDSIRDLTSKALVVQSVGIPATLIMCVALPYTNLRHMQMIGFTCLGFACILFGCVYFLLHAKQPTTVYCVYVMVGFTLQFGVNITSFVLPSALFRKEVRTSCNGVAAAIGKVGAVFGAYLFPLIAGKFEGGVLLVMGICSSLCALAWYWTWRYLQPSMLNEVQVPVSSYRPATTANPINAGARLSEKAEPQKPILQGRAGDASAPL
jgi:MFS family permease